MIVNHLTMSIIFRTLGGSGTKTVQYYNKSPKQLTQQQYKQIAMLNVIVNNVE